MKPRHPYLKLVMAGAALGIGLSAVPASAQSYNVAFATGNTNGKSFDADAANGYASFRAATGNDYVAATFTYTGPLSFNVGKSGTTSFSNDLNGAFFSGGTIGSYTASGAANGGSLKLAGPSNADFSDLSSFLNSSGSAGGFRYGSILIFDLGNLAAGSQLTIAHDDGASVYQGGSRIGMTTAGPTTLMTETVMLPRSGETYLVYGRENGAPSTLSVSMGAVPEPATWGMMILGFGAIGLALRRGVRASEVKFAERIRRIAAGEIA